MANDPLAEIREEGAFDIDVVPRDHAQPSDPSCSPRVRPAFPRPRRASSASHVNVDYFDQQGVDELSRTLTRMSTMDTLPVTLEASPESVAVSRSDVASEETLATADRPFDFEKGFRNYVKAYAI
jgi:ATP-binding cassette, subfamily G (WHITE), member 2, SNQ2